jgi:ATP-dependent Clp protease ATP-binding subunit ClpC
MEVAENIARREVDTVLQRSGIARRNLSIDIDPSVVALLVKEGYSASFGARPLRRAVERLLLLPLAKAISTGRITGDTILRLTASANRVEVKTVSRPQAVQKVEATPPLLQLSDELLQGIEALEQRILPLSDRKTELLLETRKSDFYRDEQKKVITFDEIHKLDQFISTCEGLSKVVRAVHDRFSRGVPRKDEGSMSTRLQELSAELEYLSFVATSSDARDLSDALICVRLVDRAQEDISGVETLAKMYMGFARRRRLTIELLAEHFTDKEECIYLRVTGLGAYRLFKQEVGLHQLDHRVSFRASRNGKEKHRDDREVVRVDVMPLQEQPDKAFIAKLKVTASRPKQKKGKLLAKPSFEISLFHQPSLRSMQGIFTGDKEKAIAQAQTILYNSIKEGPGEMPDNGEQLVRHYDLGAGAKIKDSRSGKMTSRIDQVLKGQLDLFLLSSLD